MSLDTGYWKRSFRLTATRVDQKIPVSEALNAPLNRGQADRG